MSTGLAVVTYTSPVCDRYCKVEGCTRELCLERPYYHRLGICAAHVREPQLLVDGRLKRFCQQCAKLHDVADFDPGKRSCRLMLERHKVRRRLRAKQTRLERQQQNGPCTELASDNDAGCEVAALLGRKPTSLRLRGQVQLADEGVAEPTTKTVRAGEGSSTTVSCRDGAYSGCDGRSGSTCSQAETKGLEDDMQQVHDCDSELNGVTAMLAPDGKPRKQVGTTSQVLSGEDPRVVQMPTSGQLRSRVQQLGSAHYCMGLDSGFSPGNLDNNPRPGLGMHGAMPLYTPLAFSGQGFQKMEAAPEFAPSSGLPSYASSTASSLQAAIPSMPQHLCQGSRVDLQPLDAAAKISAHQDAALDVEIADLLSELDSEPLPYPRGLHSFANMSRPEYGNGGECVGSGTCPIGASLYFGSTPLYKRGKDAGVGSVQSLGNYGGMDATGMVCGLGNVGLYGSAVPSMLHEGSGAAVHSTQLPVTRLESSAEFRTRSMPLPGFVPCSRSACSSHQSSLSMDLGSRPVGPQASQGWETPLAAMPTPEAVASLYGAQGQHQQPACKIQPQWHVAQPTLGHTGLPSGDGRLQQYPFQNMLCEQQQQEHPLPQLPVHPPWQQRKDELQQHPRQEMQQLKYPCAEPHLETDFQSQWWVTRSSSLMQASSALGLDGRPAQYSLPNIAHEEPRQQQKQIPLPLLQPPTQPTWQDSNGNPQERYSWQQASE